MGRQPKRLGVCLLAVSLVLAGCQAPMADGGSRGTATPTATPVGSAGDAGNRTQVGPIPNVTVLNGSLELDPGRVFARVQAVSGTSVTAPRAVRVFDTESEFYNSTPSGGLEPRLPAFWRLAGIDTAEINGSALEVQKNGYVTSRGDVVVYLGPNATLADERILLAHEFTHYVQTQRERRSDLNGALGERTTESAYLTRSVIEGGAIYTADSYVRAYAPGAKLNSPWYGEIQASYPIGHAARFQNGRYIYGYEYVTQRLETPANLSAVYEEPPRTAEQLLHGIEPGVEPPTALSVEQSTGENWLASGTDTMGEAFVRYALAGDVGPSRAEQAAAGWGNDTLRIFRPTDGGRTGYVWLLDWDDAANASEFERALRDAFDERGAEADGIWSLSEVNASASVTDVSEVTTAVTFGPRPFVTAASVGSDGETVRVDVAA